MKIKRFFARNMRTALRNVREEQGPDAVILSNRKVDGGVEVVAAVDYDESLIARAVTDTPRPGEAAAREAATRSGPFAATVAGDDGDDDRDDEDDAGGFEPYAPTPASGTAPFAAFMQAAQTVRLPEPPPVSAGLAADPTVMALREELSGMRTLLEEQMASLAWGKESQRHPHRAQILRRLAALGIDADVARAVASRALATAPPAEACQRLGRVLSSCLPVAREASPDIAGVFAVVGPTGVGKTTSVAKIAAHFALRHGRDQLALVSTDSYRIGAQEQLATFAQILDVPVHLAHGPRELAAVLGSLRKKRLVLIDTAGLSQRDAALAEQMAMFDVDGVDLKLLLALPANGQRQALDEVARRFAVRPLHGCILTKLDEAASLGAAFTTVIRHSLPLTFLTDGQKVPEDLHAAANKQQWLVNYAGRLLKASGARVEEASMARNFAKGTTHAYA